MAATLIFEFYWSFTKGHPQYADYISNSESKAPYLLNILGSLDRVHGRGQWRSNFL